MDKNLKAELSALKTEVLTGLKGLETLMGKIDTKLAESEEEACLAKCPSLQSLLDYCETLDITVPHAEWENRTFKDLVNKIITLFSKPESERYAEYMQSVLHLSKKLDKVMERNSSSAFRNKIAEEIKNGGKMDSTLISETLLDLSNVKEPISIDITSIEEQQLPNKKTYCVDIETLESNNTKEMVDQISDFFMVGTNHDEFVKGIDDTDPVEKYKQLEERLRENDKLSAERNDFTSPRAPDWAMNIGSKAINEIVKDAFKWDDYNQDLFQRQWNAVSSNRMKRVRQVLDTILSAVMNYKPNYKLNISSPEEASKYLDDHAMFIQTKVKIEMILRRIDDDIISYIELHDDPLNFKKYYDWCVKVQSQINSHNIDNDMNITTDFINNISTMFKSHMEKVEFDMYESSSEMKTMLNMTDDQDKNIKNYQYKNYLKDLKNAYQFVNNSVSIDDVKNAGVSFAVRKIKEGDA